MATLTRTFSTVETLANTPELDVNPWTPVGGATLAECIGPTSGAAKYALSGDMGGPNPSFYSARIRISGPTSTGSGAYVPLFSTLLSSGVSFAATFRTDTGGESVLYGSSGEALSEHRCFSGTGAKGDSWDTAGSGTANGLRTGDVSDIGSTTRTVFTHATWQASGVVNYLSANAGRLNAGWTHEFGLLLDGVGPENARMDTVSETITYTAPAAPGSFTLLTPADTSTGVSRTPTLTWNAAARAVLYRVRISVNSDMSSPVVDTTTTPITLETQTPATSYAVSTPLASGTLYYMRITARNYAAPDDGTAQNTDCTADFSFTTLSDGGWGGRGRGRSRSR